MKQVFVAATRQNDGKTLVSVGLLRAVKRRGLTVGYMKPVGQSYRVVDGQKIDKDVVLMNAVAGLADAMTDMSPIAVPRGFTEAYIANPDRDALAASVTAAHARVATGKDFLLLEGTGHAGVGSVFDMSNADVARLLGAKVVIVSQGGIGKPIDEILLNKAKFDVMGVEVAGVVVNRVEPARYERIRPLVTRGLERLGLPVFGVLPYEEAVSRPTVTQVCDALEGELLGGREGLERPVSRFVVGDVVLPAALAEVPPGALLILPGSREELLLAIRDGGLLRPAPRPLLSAVVLTGGGPPPPVLASLGDSPVPLLRVEADTFTVAAALGAMVAKLRAEDTEKVTAIDAMITRHVDLDRLLAAL